MDMKNLIVNYKNSNTPSVRYVRNMKGLFLTNIDGGESPGCGFFVKYRKKYKSHIICHS